MDFKKNRIAIFAIAAGAAVAGYYVSDKPDRAAASALAGIAAGAALTARRRGQENQALAEELEIQTDRNVKLFDHGLACVDEANAFEARNKSLARRLVLQEDQYRMLKHAYGELSTAHMKLQKKNALVEDEVSGLTPLPVLKFPESFTKLN